MKYNDFEDAFSAARLNKYKNACNGNTNKTLTLYRHNVKLCQKFYGVLNIFEIIYATPSTSTTPTISTMQTGFSTNCKAAECWNIRHNSATHWTTLRQWSPKANIHPIRWCLPLVSISGHICLRKFLFASVVSRFCKYLPPDSRGLDKRLFSRNCSKSKRSATASPTTNPFVSMLRDAKVWFMPRQTTHLY